MNDAVTLKADNHLIDKAFRIAIGDFLGNIQHWQRELSERPTPCIFAGLDYKWRIQVSKRKIPISLGVLSAHPEGLEPPTH